jgi:hypothetical protein
MQLLEDRIKSPVSNVYAKKQKAKIDLTYLSNEQSKEYLYTFISAVANTSLQKIVVDQGLLDSSFDDRLKITPAKNITHLGFINCAFF